MHPRDVRTAAAIFALALAGAAAAVAWWSTGSQVDAPGSAEPAAPIDGGEAFARHCERCHARDEFTGALTGPDASQAVEELLELLQDHGASTPEEDRAIADWLRGPAQQH